MPARPSAARVLPDERSGRAAAPALAALREAMARAVASGAFAADPPPAEERVGDVRLLRHAPRGRARGRLLHLHGGAYRNGAPEVASRYARAVADACGVEVLCPAYRLAPEHPFPAALIDAAAVLEALPADLPLILGGDSAGGGLAAALAVVAVARGRRLAGLLLHSPWLDLTVSASAYARNAALDALFSATSAAEAADLYLQGADPATPLASPLFADLRGLPPTLLSVGADEVLADDATRFAAALDAAAVPARLIVPPRMAHVAVIRDRASPGAAETFAATRTFLDERLARP